MQLSATYRDGGRAIAQPAVYVPYNTIHFSKRCARVLSPSLPLSPPHAQHGGKQHRWEKRERRPKTECSLCLYLVCTDSTRDGDPAVFRGRPYTAHSTQNATRILVFASLRSVVVISLELDSKIVA